LRMFAMLPPMGQQSAFWYDALSHCLTLFVK